MTRPSTGTVFVLFTDIVGSTELHERLGDETMDQLRREHFQLLREAVNTSAGEITKTMGDGVMVAFSSAIDAIGCAVAMQEAVAHYNQQGTHDVQMRVGLHAGEVSKEGNDYFGTPVVIAKRLCDLAGPGQILASDLVRALVGSRGSFQFRDSGPLSLKGIALPVPSKEIVWASVTDLPAAESPFNLAPELAPASAAPSPNPVGAALPEAPAAIMAPGASSPGTASVRTSGEPPALVAGVPKTGAASERPAIEAPAAPGRRKLVLAGAGLAGFAILAVLAVVVMGGGGGDGSKEPAAEAPPLQESVLAQDDFSDPARTIFVTRLGPGTATSGMAFDRRLENGEFVFQLTKGTASSYSTDGFMAVYDQAFALELDARAEGKIDSILYGFMINHIGEGPRLQVQPNNGEYIITQLAGGQNTTLARRLTPLVKKGPAVNHIRVEVNGSQLKVFLNGELTETIAGGITERRPINVNLGVWINSPRDIQPAEDVRVIFDNFKAVSLVPPAAAAVTRLVAEDDFSDPSKSFFPRTGNVNPGTISFDRSHVSNEYRVKILRGGNENSALSIGPTWSTVSGFAVEVECRAEGRPENLGYGFSLNSDNGLRIRVQPGQGTYRITFNAAGTSVILSEKTPPNIERGAGLNRLRIEVNGSELKFFINGTLVDTLRHDSLLQRPVAPYLAVWSLGRGILDGEEAAVIFDTFKVYALAVTP